MRTDKIIYYTRNYLRQLVPARFYEKKLNRELARVSAYNEQLLQERVNYYNKLEDFQPVGENAIAIGDLEIFAKLKTYRFDVYEYLRYFDKTFRANFLFGDIVHVEDFPSIQKSRPVYGENSNAVLMKLNKPRHFVFVKDRKKYADKKNMLVGRGTITQQHRVRFMEKYFDHPLCDLGQVNSSGGRADWIKPKMQKEKHLEYKFILSLEGNDVATNLKWIMSSNSIAVMTKPKYETWFMEGKLKPGVHYIGIDDDYEDLEEKLEFYSRDTEAAETIIRNAKAHVRQFLDQPCEDLISLLVLQKYFYYTGQAGNYQWA